MKNRVYFITRTDAEKSRKNMGELALCMSCILLLTGCTGTKNGLDQPAGVLSNSESVNKTTVSQMKEKYEDGEILFDQTTPFCLDNTVEYTDICLDKNWNEYFYLEGKKIEKGSKVGDSPYIDYAFASMYAEETGKDIFVAGENDYQMNKRESPRF